MTAETAGSKRPLLLAGAGTVAILALAALYLLFTVTQGRQDVAERTRQAESRLRDFERQELAAEIAEAQANMPEQLPFAVEWGSDANVEMEPGEIAFIHRVPGEDYGRVGIANAAGERRLLDLTCERMHVSGAILLCLEGPDITGGWTMQVRDMSDPGLPVMSERGGALPSRARVDAGSGWAAATMFASGSSYQDIGGFESVVRIFDLTDLSWVGDLSAFNLTSPEPTAMKRWHAEPNPSFWGVTFGNDGDFWVTGGFGDVTELLTGSAVDKTLQPTGMAGTCPSLSPDGKTLVYKQPKPDGDAGFQLIARDLATGTSWELGETRSVDDQVEWLDNDTILYSLHAPGADSETGPSETVDPEFDIWSLDVLAGAEPVLFLPQADSPAVLR